MTHWVQHHRGYSCQEFLRVHCEKFPSVKLFYTSAATDSSDKYEVWVCEVNPVSELHWKVKYDFACKPQHALIRVNEWPSAILCMHFHYCHSNPKNPIGFVGRGWGGVWICHVEFSHRDFTFVHVQSQWIPDNMEDMNNVNIELASVYSPEFRIWGSRNFFMVGSFNFDFSIFSCPEQLNRTHCPSVCYH